MLLRLRFASFQPLGQGKLKDPNGFALVFSISVEGGDKSPLRSTFTNAKDIV